jgi:1-phosphatidylinositol-4-phosphate 5-kinase
MKYASGDDYTGRFDEGQPDGEGTYTWANGARYTGQWRAGLKHGRAVMQWAGGERWEGVDREDVQMVDVGQVGR